MYFPCIPSMIGKYLVGIKKDFKFRLSFVIFLYFLCILPKVCGYLFERYLAEVNVNYLKVNWF